MRNTTLSLTLGLGILLPGACWGSPIRSAPVRVSPIPVSVQPLGMLPSLHSGPVDTIGSLDTGFLGAPGLSLLPQSIISHAAPVVSEAEAPAPQTMAATLEARISAVQSAVAEPLQAVADEDSSAGTSHQAGTELEAALSGKRATKQALPASEDLGPFEEQPPAGPLEALTDGHISWLRNALVDGESPLLTEPGFKAFIQGDQSSLAEILPWMAHEKQALPITLSAMYQALRRVQDSELPGYERSRLLQGLNERFAESLGDMSRSEVLSQKQKQTISAIYGRYISNRAAMLELSHHRQTMAGLQRLNTEVTRLLQPAKEGQARVEEHPWSVRPPIPVEKRGAAQDTEVSIIGRTGDWAKTIKEWQFLLEKHLRRYRIVMQNEKFSQRIKQVMTDNLRMFLGDYQRKVGMMYSGVERIVSYALPQSFANPHSLTHKPRQAVWIPTNENISVQAEKGGYVVRATFETNIQDDAVLQAVKSSIEEYWYGKFDLKKKSHSFRVELSITKLAPGAGFSEGGLKLVGNENWVTLAGPDTILLSRDVSYATPAHEFGHIMGLADEYRSGYDPEQAASLEYQNPASLMSSLSGKVLSRHRRLAFLLLRRHRMEIIGRT